MSGPTRLGRAPARELNQAAVWRDDVKTRVVSTKAQPSEPFVAVKKAPSVESPQNFPLYVRRAVVHGFTLDNLFLFKEHSGFG